MSRPEMNHFFRKRLKKMHKIVIILTEEECNDIHKEEGIENCPLLLTVLAEKSDQEFYDLVLKIRKKRKMSGQLKQEACGVH